MLGCDAIYYISENTQDLPKSFLTSTMSELLTLTKEKNTSIKSAAEISLVSLLKYGSDQSRYQACKIFTKLLCLIQLQQPQSICHSSLLVRFYNSNDAVSILGGSGVGSGVTESRCPQNVH